MEQIVEDLPIEKVVDRVDVNEIVERVDIRGVIDRLDLAEITQDVMDDIDLPSIIRESSGAMASETVQTVRVRGMDADGLVSKIVDRMLRREQRELDAPGEPRTTDVADTATHRLAHVYPAGAGERQGLRAGVVSRTVAMVIDAAYVVVLVGAAYLGFSAFRFLRNPRNVHLAGHLLDAVHHRSADPGRHRPRARLGRRRTHRRDADHGTAHRGPLRQHARIHGRVPAGDHLRRVPDRIVLVGA